jgi:glycosyltransferase involved in cell wall biosynthesis
MASKIKVLHVASSHLVGLTHQETQLAKAYALLDKVCVTVLSGESEQCYGCFDALNQSGVPFVIINGFDKHGEFIRIVREVVALLDDIQPDIVTVNTNWQILIFGLARMWVKNKYAVIYTIHGFRHNHPYKSDIARLIIGLLLWIFADRVNAPSSYVGNMFGFLRYKMVSIPLGEDDTFFEKSEDPDFESTWQFCFPGQFRAGKNQAMLIRAFAEYIYKTSDRNSRLFLPGDGELLSSSKLLACKLGVEQQVIFPGQLNREDMLDIYRKCQFAIIPTNNETFGHCIAEPLVMKRVVLTRQVGIAPDVINHGINGYFFNDEAELTELLIVLTRVDRHHLISISRNAGEIGKCFKWAEVSRQYVDSMIELLKKKDKNVKTY